MKQFFVFHKYMILLCVFFSSPNRFNFRYVLLKSTARIYCPKFKGYRLDIYKLRLSDHV